MKIKTLQYKRLGNTLSVTDGAINAAIHKNAPTESGTIFCLEMSEIPLIV